MAEVMKPQDSRSQTDRVRDTEALARAVADSLNKAEAALENLQRARFVSVERLRNPVTL